MWNAYRSSRIFAHAIRIQCIKWLASPAQPESSTEWIQSCQVVQQMVGEICASVPFHLGSQILQGGTKFAGPSLRGSPCGDDHAQSPKALGGYFILWHLFSSASVDCIPDDQRRWIRGRLRYIGHNMGINQAAVLSSVSSSRSLELPLA
jgi:hypothetical protein